MKDTVSLRCDICNKRVPHIKGSVKDQEGNLYDAYIHDAGDHIRMHDKKIIDLNISANKKVKQETTEDMYFRGVKIPPEYISEIGSNDQINNL